MLWFTLFVIVLSNLTVIAHYGFKPFAISNVIVALIWLAFPGYETGLGGLLFMNALIISIIAWGAIVGKPSVVKIGVAGVGGYLLGRTLGKM